jgi:antibiotic biosynthesis monooxygenase (ABM) superfamily enzyme
MTIIRVIAKKIGTTIFKDLKLATYMNELTQEAVKHPGYISSNSYWEFRDKQPDGMSNIFTESDWKSYNHWNNWVNSKERKAIHIKFSDVVESEEFNLLYKNIHKEDNMFLL